MVARAEHIQTEAGAPPRIEGRRVRVQDVVSYYAGGWTAERVSEELRLTLAQVHAALVYYYEHQEEIDEAIAEEQHQIETLPDLLPLLDKGAQLNLVTTPQEAAEQYDISADAVYQAIRRGRLEARKSGGTWLILRRDVVTLWGERKS